MGRPESASVTVPSRIPWRGSAQLGNLNRATRVDSKNGAGTPVYSAVNQKVQPSFGSSTIELYEPHRPTTGGWLLGPSKKVSSDPILPGGSRTSRPVTARLGWMVASDLLYPSAMFPIRSIAIAPTNR